MDPKDDNLKGSTQAEASPHPKSDGLFSPDGQLIFLTWFTFFTLLAILYKIAWKPILSALEKREQDIREALLNADKIKAELDTVEGKRQEILNGAQEKAREVIEQSKKGAMEIARIMEEKAHTQVQVLLDNAEREIREESAKAQIILREASATLAIQLTEKLLEENLTEEKGRRLVNQIIERL